MALIGKRILVVAIRAIGDLVLITPILRLLKHGVPASYLAVVADGSSSDVLRHNPHVDHLMCMDRAASRRLPWYQQLRDSLSLLKELRRVQFDVAVDLFSGPRSALLVGFCGARDRYGEDVRARLRGFMYNHHINV